MYPFFRAEGSKDGLLIYQTVVPLGLSYNKLLVFRSSAFRGSAILADQAALFVNQIL